MLVNKKARLCSSVLLARVSVLLAPVLLPFLGPCSPFGCAASFFPPVPSLLPSHELEDKNTTGRGRPPAEFSRTYASLPRLVATGAFVFALPPEWSPRRRRRLWLCEHAPLCAEAKCLRPAEGVRV